MSTMSTMSINATKERPSTLQGWRSVVPWLTVVPLAVLMAYAAGFWMIALRMTNGSTGRVQGPALTWFRESTLILPIFIFAVIGALLLAARWFGPVLHKPKTVIAAALMIVAAGTLVGGSVLAASSAYDLHLQSNRSMESMGSMASSESMAAEQGRSRGLQVKSVGFGSGILLVTNLVIVGWVVSLRGGRLGVVKTRH